MAKVTLVYGDFRPLRKGEGGYSPTKRLMVSPSSGEIISRRQFVKNARKVPTKQVTGKSSKKPTKKAATSKVPKQRKPRADKGLTRADYNNLIRPVLQDKKERQRLQKQQQRDQQHREAVKQRLTNRTRNVSKDLAKERYNTAKKHYLQKYNAERAMKGENIIPYSDAFDPHDELFYEMYDKVKHPTDYDDDEIMEAFEYLYGDDIYDDTADYDYPLGDTP